MSATHNFSIIFTPKAREPVCKTFASYRLLNFCSQSPVVFCLTLRIVHGFLVLNKNFISRITYLSKFTAQTDHVNKCYQPDNVTFRAYCLVVSLCFQFCLYQVVALVPYNTVNCLIKLFVTIPLFELVIFLQFYSWLFSVLLVGILNRRIS